MTEKTTLITFEPLARRNAELLAGAFLAQYPAKTREGYRISLRQWFGWLNTVDVRPLDAERGHIDVWVRHLSEERDYKVQTVCSKINAVSGFYKYAYLDGAISHNPALHIRRPRVTFVSTTTGLSRTQLADMLHAAEAEGATTHALVCLLGLSGFRIGETLNIDIEDLGMERGFHTVHLARRKGDRAMTVSLANVTSYAIGACKAERTTGPLLLGRDGGRMSHSASRRTVARLARKCGIHAKITPHSLRHAWATIALDAGVSPRDLVDSAGWSDARMSRYYDRNRNAIERNATHAVAAFVSGAG